MREETATTKQGMWVGEKENKFFQVYGGEKTDASNYYHTKIINMVLFIGRIQHSGRWNSFALFAFVLFLFQFFLLLLDKFRLE